EVADNDGGLSKPGHTFAGWTTTNGGHWNPGDRLTDADFLAYADENGDVTLIPVFTKNATYTVIYADDFNAENIYVRTYEFGEYFALPNPYDIFAEEAEEGWVFDCWYSGLFDGGTGDLFGADDLVSDAEILKAGATTVTLWATWRDGGFMGTAKLHPARFTSIEVDTETGDVTLEWDVSPFESADIDLSQMWFRESLNEGDWNKDCIWEYVAKYWEETDIQCSTSTVHESIVVDGEWVDGAIISGTHKLVFPRAAIADLSDDKECPKGFFKVMVHGVLKDDGDDGFGFW
ncbi:MAG: hypothetical protein FWF84_03690, partial [Kiritimatiellaeota bacterium]|nr:hypothetical protein [Kiritimatiellota bacterium]